MASAIANQIRTHLEMLGAVPMPELEAAHG
jgi:hypothetical protein